MQPIKFTIDFTRANSDMKLAYGLTHQFGLDFLDYLKEEYGIKANIDQIQMDTSCSLEHSTYVVVRVKDEDLIRRIPHFKHASSCTVIVNRDGYLGQFYKTKVKTVKHKKFGIVRKTEYHISFELDRDELVRAWVKDGCPLHWPDEEEREFCRFLFISNEPGKSEVEYAPSMERAVHKLIRDWQLRYGQSFNCLSQFKAIIPISKETTEEQIKQLENLDFTTLVGGDDE